MTYEHAQLTIASGRSADFETAFADAPAIFTQAAGFRSIELLRCIEEDHYLLVVGWDSLEDHTVRFRESPLFVQWRGLVGEFFAEPPRVLHYAVAR